MGKKTEKESVNYNAEKFLCYMDAILPINDFFSAKLRFRDHN